MKGPGTNEARAHCNDLERPASFERAFCVHLRLQQAPMSLERTSVAAITWWRFRRLPTPGRSGHLMACPKTAYLEFNSSSSLDK